MKLGNLTMEVTAEDVAKSYASEIGCYFISYSTMEDLLKIPEVTRRVMFDPRGLRYLSNPKAEV